MKDGILILDFGSQYTHLIKARLLDFESYSGKIKPGIILLLKKKDKSI